MLGPEMKETAEYRKARNLRELLDLRRVCFIEISEEEEDKRNNGDTSGLNGHDEEGREVNAVRETALGLATEEIGEGRFWDEGRHVIR